MGISLVLAESIDEAALKVSGGGSLGDELIDVLLEVPDNAWNEALKENDVKERPVEFAVFAMRGFVHDIVRCPLVDSDVPVPG